jgi:preprotein translocase subunit SecY
MIDKFRNIFAIPELRQRIFFTLSLLVVVRIGAHIPVPGINTEALGAAVQNFQNTLFGLYDLFAGGAFQKATYFCSGYNALHISIYYSSAHGCRSALLSAFTKGGG